MKFNEYEKEITKTAKTSKNDWVVQYDLDTSRLITEARIKGGLTQGQLAKLVGTQQPSIARAEGGATLPSHPFLKRIARAIGARLIAPRFDFVQRAARVEMTSPSSTSRVTLDEYLKRVKSDAGDTSQLHKVAEETTSTT